MRPTRANSVNDMGYVMPFNCASVFLLFSAVVAWVFKCLHSAEHSSKHRRFILSEPPLVGANGNLNAVLSKVTFSRECHKFPGQRHWFEWNFNDELGRAAQWYCNLISSHTCKPLILNALLLKSRVKFYWGQLNIWSVASVANRKVSNPAVQICEPLLAWSH